MRKANYYTAGIIALLACVNLQAFTQSNSGSTYLFFKPIYAFPSNSGKISENSGTIQGVTYTKGIYGSYGKGICFQVGIGKMINNNFGFELAAEWINGKKIGANVTSDDNNLSADASEKVKAFMLKPMLVLRNSGDLLSFYSKLGLAISAYSKRTADFSITGIANGQNFQVNTSQAEEIKPKVGFTAAFGLSFRVSQTIAITGELNGQMISLPVHKGHYTKYQLNGANMLPGFTTSQSSWIYEKSTSTAPGDPNQLQTRLYEPANFSYIGVSVGVKYFF